LGSWDLFGGVVATYATLDWVVDAEIDYEIRTEADGLGRGDHFSAHTSVQYRLLPAQPWRATAGFLFAVLEAKFQREARDGIGGAAAARTGGTRVFVAPGLQYATKRWIAEVAVEIPVAQDLRADAFESDVIMRSGFRINF